MHASHVAALVLAASAASPALSVPLAPRNAHATSDVVARDVADDVATKVLQLFSGNIVTRELPNPFQSIPTNDGSSSGPLSIAELNNVDFVNKPGSSPAARDVADDVATKVLQLFSGNIVTRELPNPFQSNDGSSSGPLSIAELNNVDFVNKPGSSLAARDVVDDVTTKVLQLFSGNIVTRALGDSFQSVPTDDGLSSGSFNIKDLQDPHNLVATGRRSIVDDALNTIAGLFGGGGDPGVLLGRDSVNSVREIFRRQCGASLLSGAPNFLPPVGSCDVDALISDLQNFQRDVASRSLNSLD
ncbi:hypothetical protein H4582DRAFT_1053814 [Lactarius indigo]|nr:hypothetical protein H4582DRAFT_1053814 [Lactarius indigo]